MLFFDFQAIASVVEWSVAYEAAFITSEPPISGQKRRSQSNGPDIVEPAPKKKAGINILEVFRQSSVNEDDTRGESCDERIHLAVQSEFHSYDCLKFPDNNDFDLLEWWHQQFSIFPYISRYTKFIHSILATSAPSERNFSTAGSIVTAKRANLYPSTLNSLVFLRSNWDLVDKSNFVDESDV